MNFYFREKQLKRYFKSYIKSLSFIFLSVNLAFASNAVDAIIEHHTQRRILVNTDIVGNKSSIKQESDAITGILTTTTVDTKRHASDQEKFHILKAVVGERFVARAAELKSTNGFSEKPGPNPYSAILKKLTADNTALRNHYRVLELTCDLGDCVGTGDLKSETFNSTIKDLRTLTGMGNHFYQSLIESVLWEHHLVTCDQVTQNIFELIPQFEQQNKSWLTKITLNSVVEINHHPLKKFAQTYMDSILRDTESEDAFYSADDQENFLKSLDSIWGSEYSPYQFSAAKFLVLSPYKAFWCVGIQVLCGIDVYAIAHPNITNPYLENVKFFRKHKEKEEALTKEIVTKKEVLASVTESSEKYKESNGLLETENSRINLLQEILNLQNRKNHLAVHPAQQDAHNFLCIKQWDNMESWDNTESNDFNQELLKREINMAKKLVAMDNRDNTVVTRQNILHEFLDLKEKSSRHKEIRNKLYHILLHNFAGAIDGANDFLVSMILNNAQIERTALTAVATQTAVT